MPSSSVVTILVVCLVALLVVVQVTVFAPGDYGDRAPSRVSPRHFRGAPLQSPEPEVVDEEPPVVSVARNGDGEDEQGNADVSMDVSDGKTEEDTEGGRSTPPAADPTLDVASDAPLADTIASGDAQDGRVPVSAVLFLARALDSLPVTLRTFHSVVPVDVPLAVYRHDEASLTGETAAELNTMRTAGRQVTFPTVVPDATAMTKNEAFRQAHLRQTSWWDDLEGRTVLMFEPGVIFCRDSELDLASYVARFDFVGAPWDRRDCGAGKLLPKCVGNLGLALVNRDMGRKVAQTNAQRKSFDSLWFSSQVQRQNPQARIASVDEARTFSVETLWGTPDGESEMDRAPFGARQPWLYLPLGNLELLYRVCPDLTLLNPVKFPTTPSSHTDL